MNDNRLDVITLCDYEMCPTIKSSNEAYTMIVVKQHGESYSFETSTDHNNGHSHEFVEDRALEGARY